MCEWVCVANIKCIYAVVLAKVYWGRMHQKNEHHYDLSVYVCTKMHEKALQKLIDKFYVTVTHGWFEWCTIIRTLSIYYPNNMAANKRVFHVLSSFRNRINKKQIDMLSCKVVSFSIVELSELDWIGYITLRRWFFARLFCLDQRANAGVSFASISRIYFDLVI